MHNPVFSRWGCAGLLTTSRLAIMVETDKLSIKVRGTVMRKRIYGWIAAGVLLGVALFLLLSLTPSTEEPKRIVPASPSASPEGMNPHAPSPTLQDRGSRAQTQSPSQPVPEVVAVEPSVAVEDVPQAPKAPVMGRLGRAEIDDGIREVMPELVECYQSALEVVPDINGRITAKLTISEKEGIGRVLRAEIVDAEFDDVPMEDCLLDVLEEIDFPAPGGLVIVRYPFTFSSE